MDEPPDLGPESCERTGNVAGGAGSGYNPQRLNPMALSPGSRLGPYQVTALIGSGGMGEVWRARDTKLHRDVALKVLPDVFADDPERLARFLHALTPCA